MSLVKRTVFFVFVFQLLSVTGWAQNGALKGTVTDQSDRPLTGANVVLQEENFGTTTDAFGRFHFSKIKEGIYTLKISYVGFESVTQTVEIEIGQTNSEVFSMKPSRLELSEITVSPGLELESVNTISSVDIELRPIKNSQDVLTVVPGLFIAQHAGGGKAEQIFLRGFDIDHGTDINLTLDGMPVNMVSHAHGQGYSDLHFIIPETISGVDFNKGPYYADKGNFTTAGYAAYKTKSSLEKSEVKVEGGRFNTFRTVAMINLLGERDGQNAYLATEYHATDGYFNSSQDFNRINLFGKYNNYLSESKLLTLTASTFNSKWDASGQIPQRAVDQGRIDRFGAIDDTEGGETGRTNVNLQLTSTLDNDAVLQNQIFYTKYDFELYSNFTFFLVNEDDGDQIRQQEERSIYGYKGAYSRESFLGNLPLKTEAGIAFRYDDVNNIGLSRTKDRQTVLERLAQGQIDETNVSGYVSETLDLTTKFTVNASLRFDHHMFTYQNELNPEFSRNNESKSVFSPKINLRYTFNQDVEIYFKSGIGYHSNDTRVVVAQEGSKVLPRAYGADFGSTFKPFNRMIINTALWVLELEQEFVYVGDEAIVEPSGKTRRFGIDFSTRYQFTDWLFADADLNLTQARSVNAPNGEDYIPLAPSLTSKGGLTFKFLDGLSTSLRYRYIDDRPANEDYSTTAEGYTIFDAKVRYSSSDFEVGLSAENILNTEWKEAQFDTESRLQDEPSSVSEIHFTPGTPFFLKGSLTYRF